MFILPNLDSITGFVMLFASVTAIAAWISTSSSRLSYAGLQIALAFYLINLSEFRFQTSLAVARDRAIGVLLGTFMNVAGLRALLLSAGGGRDGADFR